MKCINCFREINEGLKFCPKCGFKQPDDRAAYELEHPELADALPEEEILEKLNLAASVPRTSMSREEFVESLASDPNHESIVKIVDEGIEKFNLVEKDDQERWLAKCAELLGNKQGFYPYFVQLLSQQYEMARDLLFNQASYGMDFATTPENAKSNEEPPELPPALPVSESSIAHDSHYGQTTSYNTGYILPSPALPPYGNDPGAPVTCPICHNRISPGTTECPYCHQLLDWKDNSQNRGTDFDKEENNYLWALPVGIIAVLIIIIVAVSNCNGRKRDYEVPEYNYEYSTEVDTATNMEYEAPKEEVEAYDYTSDDYEEYDNVVESAESTEAYDYPSEQEIDNYEEYGNIVDEGDDYYP